MPSAARIAAALKAHRYGDYCLVHCVAHEDASPSLVFRDGEKPGVLLVHCYAGCEPRAILDELKRLNLLEGAARSSREKPVRQTVQQRAPGRPTFEPPYPRVYADARRMIGCVPASTRVPSQRWKVWRAAGAIGYGRVGAHRRFRSRPPE